MLERGRYTANNNKREQKGWAFRGRPDDMAYNYDTNYELSAYDPTSSAASGIPMIVWVIYLVVIAIAVASMWKVFTKAGKPGWAALVPIYNVLVELEIIGRPWWWLLLMFVPLVNIVIAIIVTNGVAKSFGKSTGWTVGLLLLPFIFWPMLAFGNAKYLGPSAAKNQQPAA